MIKKAVVLLSGGLDSATCAAIAKSQGFVVYPLSVVYGQRSASELNAARQLVATLGLEAHKVVEVNMGAIGGSALTDRQIDVPVGDTTDGIPVTYVPARNTVMLSLAVGWAEVLGASHIFTGVNALDYSGYPDCRPEYIEAFQSMANLATKSGVEGLHITIDTPLIHLTKAEIILKGVALGINYAETVSCYQADAQGRACGQCDSCRLRKQGFLKAGVSDPTRYIKP